MEKEAKSILELVSLKFSKATIINDHDLREEAKKVAAELEVISKKKLVDYEKLKAVVKL